MRIVRARTRRLLSALIAALVGSTLVVVAANTAQAQTVICTAWSVADVAKCDVSGYAAEMNKAHWGMYAGHNCTNYAAYRLIKNGVKQPSYRLGNADTWAPRAKANGVPVDSRPAVGAIGAWPGRQHVVYIEEVGKGYLLISEDAWGGSFRRLKVYPGDSNYPTQFIHFKDLSTPSAPVLSEGMFIRPSGRAEVYRIAGGAPVHVSGWAAVGGQRTVTAVSTAQFAGLPAYPKDGTFIRAYASSRVYRIAGSAPMYVSSWAAVGGEKPVTIVDEAAVANAGGAGVWAHLRATPSNRFLEGYQSGRAYRIVAGRALYVSTWTPYGGTQARIQVDDKAISTCDHLNCSPFGSLDSVAGGTGTVTVIGWAIDPNTASSLSVRLFIDGKHVASPRAGVARPAVDAAYHYGRNFGFNVVQPATAGKHQVCVVAINAGLGTNTELGCRDVQVTAKTVTLASTTKVALTSSTIDFGDAAQITATVAAPGGSTAGVVQFGVDGVAVGSSEVTGSTAKLALPEGLAPGKHDVTADFVPVDPAAVTPSGSAATLVVDKAQPSVVVESDPASATATITYADAEPATGTVSFVLDGVLLESVEIQPDGTASVQLPTDRAGDSVLSATYSGSSTVLPATADPLTLTVD